jgi:hypothetical protein
MPFESGFACGEINVLRLLGDAAVAVSLLQMQWVLNRKDPLITIGRLPDIRTEDMNMCPVIFVKFISETKIKAVSIECE